MKKKYHNFLEWLRFKYRVSILNENTLEEAWYARLSRVSVFLWFCIMLLLTFALLALLVYFTPLKLYLPGYADASVRLTLQEETARVDSISDQLNVQQEYIGVLQKIISGDLPTDSLMPIDSIALHQRERIALEKSKIEQDFCTRFEEKEKYNLSLLEEKRDVKMDVFFKPTNGVITSSFAPDENSYGIFFATVPNENIVSVQDGTVIYASFTFDFQWVILIQHKNDYLSVYKNNSHIIKKVGDNVRAGETIAVVGNSTEDNAGSQFYFELWQQGIPINPEDVIAL